MTPRRFTTQFGEMGAAEGFGYIAPFVTAEWASGSLIGGIGGLVLMIVGGLVAPASLIATILGGCCLLYLAFSVVADRTWPF